MKREIDEAVGRLAGRFTAEGWVPVRYMYRSVPAAELAAHYVAADLALVTPLRDGMNLVAKEYVASRVNDDGILILSEFAGAAEDLFEAVRVEPLQRRRRRIADPRRPLDVAGGGPRAHVADARACEGSRHPLVAAELPRGISPHDAAKAPARGRRHRSGVSQGRPERAPLITSGITSDAAPGSWTIRLLVPTIPLF